MLLGLLLAAYVISRGLSMRRSWSFHSTDVTKLRCAWIATEMATSSPQLLL
jgi:predicted transporter